MRLLRWTLIQCDWYPYERGNEDTDTQREDHVRLQQEGGHLQAEEKGPVETKPANISVSDIQPPEL